MGKRTSGRLAGRIEHSVGRVGWRTLPVARKKEIGSGMGRKEERKDPRSGCVPLRGGQTGGRN